MEQPAGKQNTDSSWLAAQRKPRWRWILGCTAALILAVGSVVLGGVVLWQKVLSPISEQMLTLNSNLAELRKPPPPAGVRIGTPLKWRVLHRSGWLNPFMGAVTCGQFDQDPDQELLVANHGERALLFQPDGTMSGCGLRLYGFGLIIEPWDYDGDGTDDIVANISLSQYMAKGLYTQPPNFLQPAKNNGENPSLLTPIFSLDGNILARLEGEPMLALQLTGKFSQDGPRQLVLFSDIGDQKRKNLFYLPGGVKAGSYVPASGFIMQNNFVDINADGLDEVLVFEGSYPDLKRWSAMRLDLPSSALPGLDDRDVLHIFDANADGHDDILSANDEYVDPLTWKAVKLQYPPGSAAIEDYYVCSAASGRFVQQQWVIAEATGVDVRTTALMLFAPDGKCLLYEEMGEDISCITCWTYNNQDHLVVCTEKRVLITP